NFCKMCGEALRAAAQPQVATNPPAAPIVTPAQPKRQSLPSALAAVVGGPVVPQKARATVPASTTMKKPMIAATPPGAPAAALENAATSPPPAAAGTRVCTSCGAPTPSNF